MNDIQEIRNIKRQHKQYIKYHFFEPMMGSNDKYALKRQYEILDKFYSQIEKTILKRRRKK